MAAFLVPATFQRDDASKTMSVVCDSVVPDQSEIVRARRAPRAPLGRLVVSTTFYVGTVSIVQTPEGICPRGGAKI